MDILEAICNFFSGTSGADVSTNKQGKTTGKEYLVGFTLVVVITAIVWYFFYR